MNDMVITVKVPLAFVRSARTMELKGTPREHLNQMRESMPDAESVYVLYTMGSLLRVAILEELTRIVDQSEGGCL